MQIDWSDAAPRRKPTRKERACYKRWIKYLKFSRLSGSEIWKRSTTFAEQGKEPPND